MNNGKGGREKKVAGNFGWEGGLVEGRWGTGGRRGERRGLGLR